MTAIECRTLANECREELITTTADHQSTLAKLATTARVLEIWAELIERREDEVQRHEVS